ncbi:MAG: aminotransferase class V-fold PLP-dependent enzyme [Clostridia bacterium]|nr:aminotransferase class V-fold PLP-dependent enzyme [Clostridia bacterium]
MIYLDHAATTFPKPGSVLREVERCITTYCGNAGRGAHPLALASAEAIYSTRVALSDFLRLGAPERIIFAQNTTHALNLALQGFLRPGAHVLISELEHNAVLRPLCALRDAGRITFDVFPVLGHSKAEVLEGIRARCHRHTSAVVCTHASNICSVTLPLDEIGALCKEKGLTFIVDAAQSAGHLPIDMQKMQISALALPSHKGLLGIQGAGALALGEGFLPEPLLYGGSGVASLSTKMPPEPPERYEAGTLPTPAIVSMQKGVEFLQALGLDAIGAHMNALFAAMRERLLSLPDIRIYQAEQPGAILLFSQKGHSSAELAHRLAGAEICCRAGLHCAPLAHKALGTPQDGAVRLSFGIFNRREDADAVWKALKA